MPVEKYVSPVQSRRIFGIEYVPVGKKDSPALKPEQGTVRRNREVKNHLIHLGIAVPPHTEQLFPPLIEHFYDLLRRVAAGQIVSGTVIENIPQQEKLVRFFIVKPFQHLGAAVRVSVYIGGKHKLHGNPSLNFCKHIYSFLFCRNEKYVPALVAFIYKIFQRFACIARIISVNRYPASVIDILLQYFPRKSGTEDKKVLRNHVLINCNIFRTCFITRGHKQVKGRLHVRNSFSLSAYNDAAYAVFFLSL